LIISTSQKDDYPILPASSSIFSFLLLLGFQKVPIMKKSFYQLILLPNGRQKATQHSRKKTSDSEVTSVILAYAIYTNCHIFVVQNIVGQHFQKLNGTKTTPIKQNSL